MRLKLILVAVTVIGLFAIAAALAYQSADESRKQWQEQMLRAAARSMAGSQPDTSSNNWRSLSGDVGLMLFIDEYGTQRGTLYVRAGGYWTPVALQGRSELGPKVLPLGG